MESLLKVLGGCVLFCILILWGGFVSSCVYDWVAIPTVQHIFNYKLPNISIPYMICLSFVLSYFFKNLSISSDKDETFAEVCYKSGIFGLIVIIFAKTLSALIL